jgi:hypothetical protein
MAKNTGRGSRVGAVTGRTQVKNSQTKIWTKRDTALTGTCSSQALQTPYAQPQPNSPRTPLMSQERRPGRRSPADTSPCPHDGGR